MMEIGTDEIYEFIFYQVFGCFLDMPAVVSGEGEQVDLEVTASLFEYFVVFWLLVVIIVSFRVSQNGAVALG